MQVKLKSETLLGLAISVVSFENCLSFGLLNVDRPHLKLAQLVLGMEE